LLHGSIGLVAAQPGCPTVMTPAEAAEWRRQKLTLEKHPRKAAERLGAPARKIRVRPPRADTSDHKRYDFRGCRLPPSAELMPAICDRPGQLRHALRGFAVVDEGSGIAQIGGRHDVADCDEQRLNPADGTHSCRCARVWCGTRRKDDS
jgi:hypothetical protein